MIAPATAFYAVVLVILKLLFVWRVVLLRQRLGVGLGDGGYRKLQIAIRVHGNYVEYLPLVLVMIFIAEMNGVPYPALHGAGLLFTASRFLHAFGLNEGQGEWHYGRALGVAGTWLALLVLCGLLVYNVLKVSY